MMFYNEKEFQETTIGKMPKAWKVPELSAIGDVSTGKTPSTINANYWNGDIPFITPVDINESKYVYSTERKVSPEGAEQSNILPKSAVLVVCIGSTIGKVAITNKESVTNQQINTIICDKDVIDPEFLYYSISFRSAFLKSFSGVAAVPIIKKSLFEHFKVPLPPLLEQKAVVKVLDTVDSAIELADKVIAKTVRLKKGFMQNLLTRGIGHTEFKDTPIGKIPESWEVAKLKSVVEIDKELRDPSREIPDKTFLYIDIESVEGGTGKIKKLKRILGREAPSRARRVIHENDVIMSTVRPYLKAFAIIPRVLDNEICSTGFAVLSHGDKILPNFLLNTLFSDQTINQCNRMMTGGQYPALNQTQVSEIITALPPLSEQHKIAEIFDKVDIKLELEKTEKEKLERIKQGLMDLLLTGKVRVKED